MIVEASIRGLIGGATYGDADMDFFTADPVTAVGVVEPAFPSTSGSLVSPSPTTLPSEVVVAVRSFTGDFYYRVWAIPLTLRAQNPRVGTPIPFFIWNAFPDPYTNDLTTITASGDETITLSVSAPSTFTAVEMREVTVTINNTDVNEIDAEFLFTFELGSAEFNFLATVLEFIFMRPDPPIGEKWEWLTDVLRSWGGKEQRVALRNYPRRFIDYQLAVENEADRREQYRRWHKSINIDVMMPLFQYAGTVTQTAPLGSSTLTLDLSSVDIRDGEPAVLVHPGNEQGELVIVDTVGPGTVTLQAPLTFDVPAGMILSPAHRGRVNNNTGVKMRSVTGNVDLNAQVFDDRATLVRPSATVTVDTYQSIPVLDRRPLAEGDVGELFDGGFQDIDYDTGAQERKSAWAHPVFAGTRNYLVQRVLEPDEMDWWRLFLEGCKGQQNPFLLPTFREDLTAISEPLPGGSELVVAEGYYVDDLFPYETYKRLEIELSDGSLLRTAVTDALLEEDGSATLTLLEPFGVATDIVRVSFLNLARLASDTVEWQHDHLVSTVEIKIKAIDQ